MSSELPSLTLHPSMFKESEESLKLYAPTSAEAYGILSFKTASAYSLRRGKIVDEVAWDATRM